jgi:hypothetical protein
LEKTCSLVVLFTPQKMHLLVEAGIVTIMAQKKSDPPFTEKQSAQRRDAAIFRALNTPHKPQKKKCQMSLSGRSPRASWRILITDVRRALLF